MSSSFQDLPGPQAEPGQPPTVLARPPGRARELTCPGFHFWQTGFVEETAAARVERVKQEKRLFWEPLANGTLEAAKWSSLQVWTAFRYGPGFPKRNSALNDKSKTH